MPVVFRPYLEKLGGETNATSYVGTAGDLFYDPTTTTLRISDGTTPGGSTVSGGGGAVSSLTASSETLTLGSSGQLTNAEDSITISPTSREGSNDYLQITTTELSIGSSGDVTITAKAGDVNFQQWKFYNYGPMLYPVLTWAEVNDAVEAGQRVFISDSSLEATASNFGEIVVGGGANVAPVWSDGSYWRIG